MTRLILMRHGNTFEEGQIPFQVGASSDLPLTAYGRVQAEEMAKFLAVEGLSPEAIFSGKLKRQAESAQIIADFFNLKVQNAAALTEIDYGLWEGLSSDAIREQWPKEYAEWNDEAKWQSHIFRGGYEAHLKGLIGWMDELRHLFCNKTVFAVTSNGLLRLLKNEKVKTGHFCEIRLHREAMEICRWNNTNRYK